jgi:hypothetical protein
MGLGEEFLGKKTKAGTVILALVDSSPRKERRPGHHSGPPRH